MSDKKPPSVIAAPRITGSGKITGNVIRIELTTEDPDAWAVETSLRLVRAELAKTPRWRAIKRRELLGEIGRLEDWLRRNAEARDSAAEARTRQLVETES